MLLKIKKSIFRTNSATYETNVKEQNYSFQKDLQIFFDHFLIKWTVFVLIVMNTIKHQKFNFLDKLYGISNNVRLQIKVVAFKKLYEFNIELVFKKLYEFNIEHFLIGIIVFLINTKNAIK